MARAKAGRQPARKTAPHGAPEDRLIDAALVLAGRQGWRQTALAQIAAEAGLPLHEAYALHRSKGAILGAFTRRVDRTVLAVPTDGEEGARERLFDILMRRFEALRPHREALRSIVREGIGHPGALFRLCRLRRSMRWMLEGAGLPATGCAGRLRLNALVLIYLSVLRVFLNDDSDDLGRTMAALDRALRRAEQVALRVPDPHRRPAASAA